MFRLKINSILIDENNEKFFGNGPLMLLKGVKEHGSLSAAAKAMDMSYSKAVKLIRNCEEALGFKILECYSGGKSGGKSVLSHKGEIFLSLYEDFALANKNYGNNNLDSLLIPDELDDVGIVIMASGSALRFHENKLIYEVEGKPLVSYVLETLKPIKDICVVSTVHKEIADIADNMGYKCALHENRLRSVSIREGLLMFDKPKASMFVPADQPLLTMSSVLKLIEQYHKDPAKIFKLSFKGKKAAPTVFPADLFEELKSLVGEEGGSAVVRKHPEREVAQVEALFPWEIWDVDEKKDLEHIADVIRYVERGKR